MRLWSVATVRGSRYITPVEFNAEATEIVAGLHSLDRDNFITNQIQEAKLAAGIWGAQLLVGTDVLASQAFAQSSGADQIHIMPDAAGAPLIRTVTTGDGELSLTLSVDMRDSAGTNPLYAWIGIRIDGALLVRSPQHSNYARMAPYCKGLVPVGAGANLIEAVYGFGPTYTAGGSRTIDFRDRVLHGREAVR